MKRCVITGVAILIGAVLSACGGEEPKAGPADDAQVQKLIQQLGAEDFATREAADIALRKLGAPVVPALRAARAAAKDAEVQKRLDALVEIWPPGRKERGYDEMHLADAKELFGELYREWLAENKRTLALLGGGYQRLKFFGTAPSNDGIILSELATLVRYKPEDTLAEAMRMQAEFEKQMTPGAQVQLRDDSPVRFLKNVISKPRGVSSPAQELWRQWAGAEKVIGREQPPTAEEWQKLGPALRATLRSEKVSMVFKDASFLDVVGTIGMQVSGTIGMQVSGEPRFFFEPAALFGEVVNEKVTCRYEEVPWEQALGEVLAKAGLTYRVEGGVIVLYRKEAKKEP
ncbi:MAG: STN domain-containing protein [Planctomycetota bacterium]|nr:STN domain-containing protein [Planctomycetota bacterium]